MEQRSDDVDEFSLREWSVKARLVSRENTSSRRFSASNLRSFREDTKSFRSNFTISSTASSPGYNLRDQIHPATYSFTTALRALQARSVYSWETSPPPLGDGLALNSKWSDAEKYICNPLSGEVPVECLSAKTLSGRYIPSLAGRVTMSAPLIYNPSYSSRPHHPKSSLSRVESEAHFPFTEKDVEKKTRDVGTQSTPCDVSSSSSNSSLTPAATPSIEERSIHRESSEIYEVDESPTCDQLPKTNFQDMVQSMNVKDPIETQEITNMENNNHDDDEQKKEKETNLEVQTRGVHIMEEFVDETEAKQNKKKEKQCLYLVTNGCSLNQSLFTLRKVVVLIIY